MLRHLLIGANAIALAACAAGPEHLPTASDVSLPPAFHFAPDPVTRASVASLLPSNDPAFVALADAAVRDAPTLAAAIARIDAARANADRGRAERLPQVDAAASVASSRSSTAQTGIPAIPGISIDRTRTSYGANLTARWDADLFGGLRAQQRAALARLDAAGADAAAVRLALLAEIAGSVVDWRTLSAREERLRQDLSTAERLIQLAAVRERAGIAAGIDRVQAEAVAAGSRSGIAALASERARIMGRLVTLTAQPGSLVDGALRSAAAHGPLSPVPTSLPSTLLTNRPDVLSAGARLRAANADVAAAAAARFPRLTLSGALGLLALSLGDLFDSDALSGSLGADLAGPLLDFGRIDADMDQAEARTREAFANYREAVFTALGDAEGGYALVSAADGELAAAQAEAAANDRAARLAEERFRAGLTSFLDVLDARRLAIAAGERAAAARGRAERARVALWLALGGS